MQKQIHKKFIPVSFLTSDFKIGIGVVEFLMSVLVIAIVSSLTIPLLFLKSKTPENQQTYQKTYNDDSLIYKQPYKKAYADASQVWTQLYSEGLLKPRTGWGSDQSNYDNFTQFMTKLNAVKKCDPANNLACWAKNETTEVVSAHPDSLGDRCFVDSSGRAWCEVYYQGWFIVDTNGHKNPNLFGKDRFIFYTIVGNDINASGIPDKIIFDNDYSFFDINKCPNPPCYYTSWISQ